MKILILKTWLTNIGNGFIDKGAVAITRQAFPDATIVEVGGYSNFVADQKARLRRSSDLLSARFGGDPPKRMDHPVRENIVNISKYTDPDLVIFPGCILYEWAMRKYWDTLTRLSDENVPIVFLGAGGGEYDEETKHYMKDRIAELQPHALITRDDTAYNLYSDLFEFSHNGIDCAFFINEFHSPPNADREFVAATFDKRQEPDLQENSQIVRPHHYDPLQGTESLKRFSPFSKPDHPGTFYSDCLEDYLFIYSNAEKVHTDRIHACIPSLVFDTPAQFYFETPRADLFKNIDIETDDEGFMSIDRSSVENKRDEQVRALRDAVTN